MGQLIPDDDYVADNIAVIDLMAEALPDGEYTITNDVGTVIYSTAEDS